MDFEIVRWHTYRDSEYQLNNQWRDENKRCKGSYYFMYFHAVIYLVQIQGHQICFKCYPCAGTWCACCSHSICTYQNLSRQYVYRMYTYNRRYSVNDTIVIFDRIRENLHGIKKYSADELADIANESLTQTLSRSINTSLTTFVMVLLLFIFGHTSIREFSLPLMVGVLCGTYSSICIATELWYVMKLYLARAPSKSRRLHRLRFLKKAKN